MLAAVIAGAIPGSDLAAQALKTPAASRPAEMWAVVIGIDAYPQAPRLTYAVNSARAIERLLPSLGVPADHIVMMTDQQATRAAIEKVLAQDFRTKLERDAGLFVFFAGQSYTQQIRPTVEEGYLLPVDGDPQNLAATAISVTSLRQASERLRARHALYVVDACFSGYPLFNRSVSDQLLDEFLRNRTVQILTAGRRQDACHERDGTGLFTNTLVRGLQGEAYSSRNWLALEELGAWVRKRVAAESKQKQIPQYGTLVGEGQFIFNRPTTAMASVPSGVPISPPLGSLRMATTVPGVEVWVGDRRIGETAPGRLIIASDLPAGTYRVRARKAGHQEWEREVQIAANGGTDVAIDIEPLRIAPNAVTPDDLGEMVLVSAGEFWMGTTSEESARLIAACRRSGTDEPGCRSRYAHESPRHRIHLDAFYIDRYEVTNAQYQRFVAATNRARPPAADTGLGGPTQPVGGVTWTDADAYCKLAAKRLPTEAEWEKAARGPDGRRYPWGDQWDDQRANGDRRLPHTTPVGSYPSGASPYGIHDMAGNVWEWVADWYAHDTYSRWGRRQNPTGPSSGERKVLRGGSLFDSPDVLRSAARLAYLPTDQDGNVGFRCARSAK